jgi:2-keto-3-deoxy-L-rhamnonate aldolase RhmA
MNLMCDFSHPEIKAAIEAVVACAEKHGKPVLVRCESMCRWL